MNFVFFRLAQVVQLRISNTPSLMSRFDGDNILVVGIRNSADQLINPMDCLYEHQTHDEKSLKLNDGELIFRAEVIPQSLTILMLSFYYLLFLLTVICD